LNTRSGHISTKNIAKPLSLRYFSADNDSIILRNVGGDYTVSIKTSNVHNTEVSSQILISRRELAQRWSCSTETVKRRTREGVLHPVRFNSRMIRYAMSEVVRIEQEASGAPW
jgi:hypothetical protein